MNENEVNQDIDENENKEYSSAPFEYLAMAIIGGFAFLQAMFFKPSITSWYYIEFVILLGIFATANIIAYMANIVTFKIGGSVFLSILKMIFLYVVAIIITTSLLKYINLEMNYELENELGNSIFFDKEVTGLFALYVFMAIFRQSNFSRRLTPDEEKQVRDLDPLEKLL